jgi:hypothetical protein
MVGLATMSLGTTNESLVSFRKGLAPAAGNSWCPPSQEKIVGLGLAYLCMLFLFPNFTLLASGILVLSLVGIL